MRRLSQILAAVLLATWLPATLHCHLAAAGVIQTHCLGDGGHDEKKDDGCDLVEGGRYKGATDAVRIAAPALLTVAFMCVAPFEWPPAETEAGATNPASEPQALRRTWQFVERAAPPCRAPSAIA